MSPLRCLVFGGRGWIGEQLCKELSKAGHVVIHATVRADDTACVSTALDTVQPDRVICLVGRTHGPGFSTIDYLEQPGKLVENVRDNLFAPVSLGLLCQARGIHMTYMGTGCIFEYDEGEHAMSDGAKGFKEDDAPNFFGSSYSVVKGFTDRLMHLLPQTVLNVRIRMPIVGEHHPRNFITKITQYAKVCSLPNSMTVLPTLLPRLVTMVEARAEGTVNLTNPGVITHNEILEMYREIVDPAFRWENFSVEEQNTVLASRRSNNHLDTGLLEALFPTTPRIHEAVRTCLESIKTSASSSADTASTPAADVDV
jgi:3,5-epimerase/4-reductase